MKDGGPAFPGLAYTPGYGCSRPVVLPSEETVWEEHSSGMTLRDYFAAKAMHAALMPDSSGSQWRSSSDMAAWAYATADAMLAEREKQ